VDLEQGKKYAGVVIDISHEKVDRLFHYRIPEHLCGSIREGMEVVVPFGAGNKMRKAYVMEITDFVDFPEDKIKWVESINDKAIGMEQKVMSLAYWMKRQYGCTMIAAMQTVLPVKKKIKALECKTIVRNAAEDEILQLINKCNPLRQAARLRILKELLVLKELPFDLVTGKLGVSAATIKSLEEKGVVIIRKEREYRNAFLSGAKKTEPVALTPLQQRAAEGIINSFRSEKKTVLLHGITGSGKTEVYMEAIAACIRDGKQAIVLIPEIALTFQTLKRFYMRFGDRVSVLHSKMSDGERFDQYERAKNGMLDIIIGPRSALFAPFPNLGLIVIDEEHESSYKSEKMPKYHAREVAQYLCEREDALLVLGSATPSVDSYYRAKKGDYLLYELDERIGSAKLPSVHTVDMREELKAGNKSFFSRKLKELMTERFVRGEQVMLFINRRGYAGFVSCRECGEVIKCPHCDVSLSQHGGNRNPYTGVVTPQSLVCHYCGYAVPMVTECPTCKSKKVAGFRAGTQRLEEALKAEYPSVRILRMDADTTKKKEDYEKILSAFAAREADVLIGTQMIVKGHDFSNVTLVGVVAADLSLFAANYMSGERTFQLLTQAAGRAGRGEKKGEVVIQTYQPDNYSVLHASSQDYKAFYEEEMVYRTFAKYPPVCHMLAVQLLAGEEERIWNRGESLAKWLKEEYGEEAGIIGPAKGVVSKVKDIFRVVIYIKHPDMEMLIRMKDAIEEKMGERDEKKEVLQFDFDPINMM